MDGPWVRSARPILFVSTAVALCLIGNGVSVLSATTLPPVLTMNTPPGNITRIAALPPALPSVLPSPQPFTSGTQGGSGSGTQETPNCSLPVIAGANMSEDTYSPGQNTTVQCLPGFVLQGISQLLCDSSGQWSTALPKCLDVNECATSLYNCSGNSTCNNTLEHARIVEDTMYQLQDAFVSAMPGF
eukprot:scpid22608/ scgid24665/ Sushi, von Willebrand factor type A, EGF and pentraxin domain-containing protein 1; Polydom